MSTRYTRRATIRPCSGCCWALAALLLAGMLYRRGWLPGRRFWLTLLLLAAGMFLIGFLRADSVPLWAGLRSGPVAGPGSDIGQRLAAVAQAKETGMIDCELLLRGGLLYDGSGAEPVRADLALAGDRIIAVLPPDAAVDATRVLDVAGLAVAPGFINMLSWSNESLIEDGPLAKRNSPGRDAGGDGRGRVHGPAQLRDERLPAPALTCRRGDILYDVGWTTLGEYLEWLAAIAASPATSPPS